MKPWCLVPLMSLKLYPKKIRLPSCGNKHSTMAVLSKTLQLPPKPPMHPPKCMDFTDCKVEMGPSPCSHIGHNYRPLPVCLPSQSHPRIHRGSLPPSLPPGCWHPVGHGTMSCGSCMWFKWGRRLVYFVKLKQHHVTPQQNVPGVLQTEGLIRLENGEAAVTECRSPFAEHLLREYEAVQGKLYPET